VPNFWYVLQVGIFTVAKTSVCCSYACQSDILSNLCMWQHTGYL